MNTIIFCVNNTTLIIQDDNSLSHQIYIYCSDHLTPWGWQEMSFHHNPNIISLNVAVNLFTALKHKNIIYFTSFL